MNATFNGVPISEVSFMEGIEFTSVNGSIITQYEDGTSILKKE
jgi:hypothetical protein